jgi:hypothetical protein
MEFQTPDSHQNVPVNREPTETLIKWDPAAWLNPFNNCLLLAEPHDRVFCMIGAYNELLYTKAIIIRSIIISHIYIGCFYLSEPQAILHIISLIIK